MTRPVDIPGSSSSSSSSTDNGDSSRVAPTTAPPATALRQRGHTFAYPRAEANGNAHHLPPDAHTRGLSASARSPNVGASSSSSPGSAILNLLGLSPRSSTWGNTTSSSSFGAAYTADPAYSPSTTASSVADDPPEAVTPPSYAYPYSPSVEDEHNEYLNKKAQLHELDDVFDEMGALSGAPSGYAHHARSASASTARPAYFVNHGRRASMSIMPDGNDSFAAHNKERSNSSSSSSSPLGLFRRLSLSTSRKPVVPAPASVQDVAEDDPRMGRPLTKVKTAPARRLSPMGERIIRNHYDAF